jgi:hypothetical protein
MTRAVLGLLLLLAPAGLPDDPEARSLFKELQARIARARTLRIEGRVSTQEEEGRTDATFSVRMRGTDRWAIEIREARVQRDSVSGFSICATCDGQKIVLAGGPPGATIGRLKPDQVGRLLRGLLLSAGISSLERFLSADGEPGPSPPPLEGIRDGGTDRVGEAEARVLEGTVSLDDKAKVRLLVEAPSGRIVRRELTERGIHTTETYTAFAVDEDLPDSDFTFQSPRRLGRAETVELARSVALFTAFTGRYPRTLEDLVRRPADLDADIFYPEGGFLLGRAVPPDPWSHPFELRLERGRLRVICRGADGRPGGTGDDEDTEVLIPVAPHRAVAAPTDRLRRQYAARIDLELLAGAVRLYSEATGGLPRTSSALWERPADAPAWPEGGVLRSARIPLDPWGETYRILVDPDRVRVEVQNPLHRALTAGSLTPDETRALTGAARVRLSDGERRAVRGLLDRLSEDDLDARGKAHQELLAWGAAIDGELGERLGVEKDPETRLRIEAIRRAAPIRQPAWARQLTPLALTITAGNGIQENAAALSACSKNLSELWKLEVVHSLEFGGPATKMVEKTGKEFWLALASSTPALLKPSELEMLVCPASGLRAEPGVCSYRGPAKDVALARDGDIVGMCDDEGHGDVALILRKSGEISVVSRNDAVYEEALEKTRP